MLNVCIFIFIPSVSNLAIISKSFTIEVKRSTPLLALSKYLARISLSSAAPSNSVKIYPCTVNKGVFNSCATFPKKSRRKESRCVKWAISSLFPSTYSCTLLVSSSTSVVTFFLFKSLISKIEISSYIFLTRW